MDPEVRVRRSAAQSLSRILGQDVSAVVDLDEGRSGAGRSAGSPRCPSTPCVPRSPSAPRPSPPGARPSAPRPPAPEPVRDPAPAPRPRSGRPRPALRPSARAPPSALERLCGDAARRGARRHPGPLARRAGLGHSGPTWSRRARPSPCWWPGARSCGGATNTSPLRARYAPRGFTKGLSMDAPTYSAKQVAEMLGVPLKSSPRRSSRTATPARRCGPCASSSAAVRRRSGPPRASSSSTSRAAPGKTSLSTSYAWRLAELGYARAAGRPGQPGPRHQVPGLRGRGLRADAPGRAGAQDAPGRGHPEDDACPTWTSCPPTSPCPRWTWR